MEGRDQTPSVALIKINRKGQVSQDKIAQQSLKCFNIHLKTTLLYFYKHQTWIRPPAWLRALRLRGLIIRRKRKGRKKFRSEKPRRGSWKLLKSKKEIWKENMRPSSKQEKKSSRGKNKRLKSWKLLKSRHTVFKTFKEGKRRWSPKTSQLLFNISLHPCK